MRALDELLSIASDLDREAKELERAAAMNRKRDPLLQRAELEADGARIEARVIRREARRFSP